MKPEGLGWKKVHSVTSGGKSYFWFRRLKNRREWFVWNRFSLKWELVVERTHS